MSSKGSPENNNTKDLDNVVFKETVDALYMALPLSVIANVIIASTLVYIIWPVIEHSTLMLWLSLMVVINIIRFISYKAYIHGDQSRHTYWDTLFYILLIITGIIWLGVSVWLVPGNESIYHYLPVLILIGIGAGAVTVLSYSMRNLITYFILVVGPVALSELLIQTPMSNSVAGLSLLIIILSLSNAKRINKAMQDNIRLRYKSQFFNDELIENKNEAVAANSAKTKFISMISHELRTPLNGILGFSQLLKMSDTPPLNEEQDEQVDGILESGGHLLSLIEELLELTKIESNNIDISIVDVSLANSLDESISILKTAADKYNIKIINNVENIHIVKADDKRLKQVFLNLLSNSIKYNHVNGSIVIEANQLLNEKIRVSITDEGDGLTEEQMKNLFKVFTRYDKTKEGIGLGLFITQNLVELMKGSIGVESEVGKGSTFWFELPLSDN